MRFTKYPEELREGAVLKNYTYRLTEADHDKLDDIAEQLGIGTTTLVRIVLRSFIEQHAHLVSEADYGDELDTFFN